MFLRTGFAAILGLRFFVVHISSAIFDCSAPSLDFCPDESLPEFAFIGRSNVGKSSLLNMLAGEQGLARVSTTPGFTKLINVFTMNNCWRLVDLPGYGFAQGARKDRARFNQAVSDYLENRPNLSLVFALIDSGLAPQAIDLEFVEWLVRHAVPFVFVFTKTDKVSAVTAQANIAAFADRISAWFEKPPGGVHLFSRDSAGPAGVARGNRRGDDRNQHRVNSGRGTCRKLTQPKSASTHSGKPKTASRPPSPLVLSAASPSHQATGASASSRSQPAVPARPAHRQSHWPAQSH